jgi:hypothetical protein
VAARRSTLIASSLRFLNFRGEANHGARGAAAPPCSLCFFRVNCSSPGKPRPRSRARWAEVEVRCLLSLSPGFADSARAAARKPRFYSAPKRSIQRFQPRSGCPGCHRFADAARVLRGRRLASRLFLLLLLFDGRRQGRNSAALRLVWFRNGLGKRVLDWVGSPKPRCAGGVRRRTDLGT